jgi:hypothetical protein
VKTARCILTYGGVQQMKYYNPFSMNMENEIKEYQFGGDFQG